MAKELVLDVVAKKNSRELSALADEFDRLATQTDDFGKKMHESGTFTQFLDEQIAKTKVQVKELGDEFQRTGSKDVFANLRGAQANLKSLERVKTDLAKAIDDGAEEGLKSLDKVGAGVAKSLADGGRKGGLSGGVDFAKQFVEGFQSSFKPSLITAAIAAGVVMAPGALLAATGLVGIGAGIVGQLHSADVRQAVSDLGHGVADELGRATQAFEQPLVRGARVIGDALQATIGSLDFHGLAAEVEPLAEGIAGLLRNLSPGLSEAFQAAVPVIDRLASDLPKLGDLFSKMFEEIASAGPGAQEGITTLLAAVGGLAVELGAAVAGVSKLYEQIIRAGDGFTEWLQHIDMIVGGNNRLIDSAHRLFHEIRFGMDSSVNPLGKSLTATAADSQLTQDSLDKLASQVTATTTTVDTLRAAMAERLFTTIMNVDQSVLGWNKSLLDLHDTLGQNGRAIDKHTGLVAMNTQAGIANREAVLASMTANMQQYQAFVAAGGSADEATKRYDANTAALEKQLHAAGYNTKQIDDMIGSLKDVPKKTDTEIAMHGLVDALNNLGNLLAYLNHLNGAEFGFTVTETQVYNKEYHDQRLGEYTGKAAGGPVAANTMYVVGEKGPELFVPSGDGYIVPNHVLTGRSGYATPASFGGGTGGTTINLTVNAGLGADGYTLGRQVAEVLRPYIRGRGGDVQVALGT